MNKWKAELFKAMDQSLLASMQAEFNKRWVFELKREDVTERSDVGMAVELSNYTRKDGVDFTPAQTMFVETYLAAYYAAMNQLPRSL